MAQFWSCSWDICCLEAAQKLKKVNTITKIFQRFLSIVFVIHILLNTFLNLPKFQHLIIEAYAINAVLAIGIFCGLSLKRKI